METLFREYVNLSTVFDKPIYVYCLDLTIIILFPRVSCVRRRPGVLLYPPRHNLSQSSRQLWAMFFAAVYTRKRPVWLVQASQPIPLDTKRQLKNEDFAITASDVMINMRFWWHEVCHSMDSRATLSRDTFVANGVRFRRRWFKDATPL